LRGAAVYGHSERYADVASRVNRSLPGTGLAEMEASRQAVQVADAAAEPAYDDLRRLNPDFAQVRSALYVPIVKESDLIGAFMMYRHEVRSFSEKQVDLVQNFARQAVIAIDNTRLLNELRESLEQQTATSEVLGVISSSPGELKPVFETMLANATRLCDAKFGLLKFLGTWASSQSTET
jgi:GAF domain-containing protein